MRPITLPVRWAVLTALMLGATIGCVSVDAEKTGPRPSRSAGAAGAGAEEDSGVSGPSGHYGSGGAGRHHADRAEDGKADPKRSGDPASPSPTAADRGPGLPTPSGSGVPPVVVPGATAGAGDPVITLAPVTPDPSPPVVTDPAPGGDAGGQGQPAETPPAPEEPTQPAASPAE
ncbi:hypothetical protein [Streptomyces sp. NBC_00102]|uniref:hypothetical protein n=1 Tax=Streptomyces sp. NBC_00102 TaxID=2975652 RepID=UPI0022509A94|nr:hypothetical protein [Streptomyces sp. NBC_00102]MCX5398059.1 hypothetical protein [Streptomyces sp. NBC_00102]